MQRQNSKTKRQDSNKSRSSDPVRKELLITSGQNCSKSRSSDPVLEEIIITSGQNNSSDPGTDHLHSAIHSAQGPEANDHYVQYIRGFTDLASAFNWGVVALTLGSYGMLLSTPVFWVCWSILVTEAVIFYSIRPYWNWIENSCRITDQSQDGKKLHRPSDHAKAGVVFIKVGMSIALVTLLLYNQNITQRQTKILLFAALSIIIFEGFTHIFMIKEELGSLMGVQMPSNVSEDHKWKAAKFLRMSSNISEDRKWNAANFLTPSVINAMIGATGAIVLGGNLGSLMPEKPYWIFASIFVVDLLAEAIHRFDCGKRSLLDIPDQHLGNIHYVAIILRLVVEGCLCYWMTKEICQDSYFPSNVDINACDGQCQDRSRQLLITMVALGGIQAAGTCIIPICSFILGPHYLPFMLFFAIVLTSSVLGHLLWLLTTKLFCALKYLMKINCTDG
ncbi:hypothetical protein SUGI_0773230 [Cryptomeria japonica]|uniref:uncharacterized protein LOC131071907 n=1 Tax=Cryptomeria japonica TaxID=3369 RepID=UPI002414A0B4|nr:uncharacterized protein LOC131071907 [Cryptomeria japonica]GLJ37988.1 hypothetical protein SUGI_0773230 [Cryptomeria japonica]